MEYAEDSRVAVLQQPPTDVPLSPGRPWQNLKRTTEFWLRAAGVYTAYKGHPGVWHARPGSIVAVAKACLMLLTKG